MSLSIMLFCLCVIISIAEGFVHQPSRRFGGVLRLSTIDHEREKIYRKDLAPIDMRPQIMPNQHLISLTDGEFFERVLDSDGLSVVIFSSDWCGPCKSMERNILDVSMGHSAIAKFYRIDTDYNPDAAADFQVRSIPSTLFYKGGRLVSEIVGTVPSNVVLSQLLKHSVVLPTSFN